MEEYWREQAERLPLSSLRTELYEELRTCLKLRREECWSEVEEWASLVEARLLQEYESSEEEASTDEMIRLAELFSSEGVEAWLECLDFLREGADDQTVLEQAERGQRFLRVVQMMAQNLL